MSLAFLVKSEIERCLGIRCLTEQKNSISIVEDSGNRIFSSKIDLENESYPTATIWNFDVYAPYQGKNIARRVLKTIVSELLEQGIDKLEMMMVRHDGLTFWPRMGAFPNNIEDITERGLQFHSNNGHFAANDAEKLAALSVVAREDPIKAWFMLTDKDGELGLENETLAELNSSWSGERSMYFDLKHPVVQQRLGISASPALEMFCEM